MRSGSRPVALASTATTFTIFVAAVVLFVPLAPSMPSMGLDPSWRLALNEAIARGFVFGSQIIFTYGPYAPVFYAGYHPSTIGLITGAGLFLALAYATALRLLAPRSAVVPPILLCAFVSLPAMSRDVLFLSLNVLTTLVMFKMLSPDREAKASADWIWFAFVCSSTGLLPLVKGSFLIISAATMFFNVVAGLACRRIALAIASILAPIASCVVCWMFASQSLIQLPPYLASILSTVSGYSEAMGVFGDPREIWAFLASATLLIAVIATDLGTPSRLRLFLVASCGFYLFIAFKSGFVRHDASHGIAAARSIPMLALALMLVVRSVRLLLVTVVSMALWVVIEHRLDPAFPTDIAYGTVAAYRDAGIGLVDRWEDPTRPERAYRLALDRIRAAYRFPELEGSTDIYSFDQANLIATGAVWTPRPVFQSYVAYDGALLRLNAAHLDRTTTAPVNLVFAVQPMVGRLPSLEDGASWPAIFDEYHAVGMVGTMLILHRNEIERPAAAPTPIADGQHRFGETIVVPRSDDAVFATFGFEPTRWGGATSLVLKVAVPRIELTLDDGTMRSYQLSPSMARSSFVLSPLVEDSDDFANLFHVFDDLPSKRVRSFRVVADDHHQMAWQDVFQVTFALGRTPSNAQSREPGLPIHHRQKPIQDETDRMPLSTDDCEGEIERFGASIDGSGRLVANGILPIAGWLFDGIHADRIGFLLEGRDGAHAGAALRRPLRSDLAAWKRDPAFANAAFVGAIDLTGFSGDYVFHVTFDREGRRYVCSPLDRSLSINVR